jgi:hypothetical protein
MSINNQSYQNITEAAYNVMSGKKSLNEGFAGYDYDPPFSGAVGNPPDFSFVQPLNFISLYIHLQNAYDSPYEMAEAEYGGTQPFEPDDGWDRFFVMDQFGVQNYDYNGDGIVDFSDFLILFNMAFNPGIPYYINAPFYQRMLEKGAESRIPTVRPPKNPLADRPGTRPTDPTPPIGGVREEIMGADKKRNPLFGGSESDMIRQIAAKAMSGGEIPKVPSAGGMPQMGGMKPPAGGMPQMGGMKPPAGGMPQMGGMPKMGGMKPPVAPQGMEQGMGMKPQMSGMGAMGGMKPPAPAPEMPSMSDQPDIKKKLQNIVPFDPEKKKKKGMMGIEGEAMQAYQGARAGRQMFKTQARRGY